MAYSDCEPILKNPRASEAYTQPSEQSFESFESITISHTKDIAHSNDITIAAPCHAGEALTPFAILVYLRSIKEVEVYYYLFNQIGIVSIERYKLEITREGADKGLNNRLAEILFAWTGAKWNVMIADTSDQPSLKEKMKAKFMESEEWKILQDYSGGVTLTDIILD